MALFGIQRYVGDEQEDQNKDEILQDLQNKIAAKRKRKIKDEEKLTEILLEKPTKEVIEEPLEKTKHIGTAEIAEKVKLKVKKAEKLKSQDTFGVIGEAGARQKQLKVDNVLPAWLAHPTIIAGATSGGMQQQIDDLTYLNKNLQIALKEKLQINQLFPVQQAVIPWLLQAHKRPLPFRPRDLCVSAPTGSGKTLAFVIPVVQMLSARVQKEIRALIVLPVAELALQIYKVFLKLIAHTDLSVQLLSKQTPFHKEQEQLVGQDDGKFYSKSDIIVTTPGRLIDHLHATKGFSLHGLQFLIIDEADRIIDAGFQNWLQHYDQHMGANQQSTMLNYNNLLSRVFQPHKLLFSATLTQDPEKLQRLKLFHPILFSAVAIDLQALQINYAQKQQSHTELEDSEKSSLARYVTPKELTEKYCITEASLKPLTLFTLITEHKWHKFLCFTNSAESAFRLCFVLNHIAGKTHKFEQLTAQMTAKARANILNQFTRGKIEGLICSDALARGIDVPHVDVIVSYDLPRHIKTYIHRIGRTARAGRTGCAVTLLANKELNGFKKLLMEVNKHITKEQQLSRSPIEENFGTNFSNALKLLRVKLVENQKKKAFLEKKARTVNILQQKTPNSSQTLVEKLQNQLAMRDA